MKSARKTPIRAAVQKRLKRSLKYLIGIDEVGRGPLAGPVTVCACMIPASLDVDRVFSKIASDKKIKRLTDSKGLKEKDRDAWNGLIRDRAKSHADIFFSIKSATAKEIDGKGIAVCIRALIIKCLAELQKKHGINPDECLVLLDGGLKAPEVFINQETHIKGDVKFPVISFASILAKVHRDDFMKKISNAANDAKRSAGTAYANYGFGVHKGYGTLAHRNEIKKYGLSDMHRRSFCRKINALTTS